MVMIRKNFYVTQAQHDFLTSIDEKSVSEHIRRAVDDYIAKKLHEAIVAKTSPSKKGDTNGRIQPSSTERQ